MQIEQDNRFVRFLRRYPKWILILIGLLIVIRLLIPPFGKWFINKQLETKLDVYTGHIDDFDLQLYRGAFQIQGLTISKRDTDLPPLLEVRKARASIAWRSLLHKMINADIFIQEPVIRAADSKKKEKRQLGVEEPPENWKELADMFPLDIETFDINNGAVYFTNNDLKEPLPVKIEELNVTVHDLRSRNEGVPSPFSVDAKLQEHANFSAQGEVDILSEPYKADVDFMLENFRVNTINKLLLVYVPIDVTKGNLSVYGEAASAGDMKGYVKVFFKDGDVVAPKQDIHGPKHLIFEIFGGLGNFILQNNKSKNVAAEIPFKMTGKKLDIDGSKAFWSAIENKSDKLPKKIDHKISLKNVSSEENKHASKNDKVSKSDSK